MVVIHHCRITLDNPPTQNNKLLEAPLAHDIWKMATIQVLYQIHHSALPCTVLNFVTLLHLLY